MLSRRTKTTGEKETACCRDMHGANNHYCHSMIEWQALVKGVCYIQFVKHASAESRRIMLKIYLRIKFI
jgi:hypothetical protein